MWFMRMKSVAYFVMKYKEKFIWKSLRTLFRHQESQRFVSFAVWMLSNTTFFAVLGNASSNQSITGSLWVWLFFMLGTEVVPSVIRIDNFFCYTPTKATTDGFSGQDTGGVIFDNVHVRPQTSTSNAFSPRRIHRTRTIGKASCFLPEKNR